VCSPRQGELPGAAQRQVFVVFTGDDDTGKRQRVERKRAEPYCVCYGAAEQETRGYRSPCAPRGIGIFVMFHDYIHPYLSQTLQLCAPKPTVNERLSTSTGRLVVLIGCLNQFKSRTQFLA
jgi:hypothetical protein